MNTRTFLIVILCLGFSAASFAQPGQTTLSGAYVPPPRDQTYTKELNAQRRVKEWPYLRESDVLWKKRVWEQIDLKQKINYPLFYPIDEKAGRKALWHIIYKGLNDGDITAYQANTGPAGLEDDEFTEVVADVKSVSCQKIAQNPNATGPNDTDFDGFPDNQDGCPNVCGLFNINPAENGCPPQLTADMIVRYQLKEDWIFDKQRSQRFVRIIGIAPMIDDPSRGIVPLFWMYYPECRGVFALSECFNTQNDAFRGTFEDLFETRHFSAYITKEENVFDRKIEGYAQGVDALLEGERIKKEIFEYEHDLWNY
jgi:gliding motility associated protien GldN